jgi:hypothetical protein
VAVVDLLHGDDAFREPRELLELHPLAVCVETGTFTSIDFSIVAMCPPFLVDVGFR